MERTDQVLIITQELDLHADHLVQALGKRGVGVLRFHTKDFPLQATINMKVGRSGAPSIRIACGSGTIEADRVRSVWFRRPDLCELDPALTGDERAFAAKECEQTIHGLYRMVEGLWVNRPDNVLAARSKLVQLRKAAELGLRVPDTLITNDPAEFVGFFESHSGNVITKIQHQGLLSVEKSLGLYTTVVPRSSLEKASLIRRSPCLFQEHVAKEFELRVTIIGRRVFAAALESQKTSDGKTDWRQAAIETIPHRPYALPREIEHKLLRMTEDFGLNYGAVDMIVTPQGEHVFLEINPNGQFGWLDEMAGLPLYDCLADILASGRLN